jgi:hypothetical protein
MPSKKPTLSARTVAVELLAASPGPRKVKEVIAEALADPRSSKMKGKTPEAILGGRVYPRPARRFHALGPPVLPP